LRYPKAFFSSPSALCLYRFCVLSWIIDGTSSPIFALRFLSSPRAGVPFTDLPSQHFSAISISGLYPSRTIDFFFFRPLLSFSSVKEASRSLLGPTPPPLYPFLPWSPGVVRRPPPGTGVLVCGPGRTSDFSPIRRFPPVLSLQYAIFLALQMGNPHSVHSSLSLNRHQSPSPYPF